MKFLNTLAVYLSVFVFTACTDQLGIEVNHPVKTREPRFRRAGFPLPYSDLTITYELLKKTSSTSFQLLGKINNTTGKNIVLQNYSCGGFSRDLELYPKTVSCLRVECNQSLPQMVTIPAGKSHEFKFQVVNPEKLSEFRICFKAAIIQQSFDSKKEIDAPVFDPLVTEDELIWTDFSMTDHLNPEQEIGKRK